MNKEICGAKNRQGNPCKRSPAKGSTRCKLHGGASLKGTESGSYKHGLYSKYAGDSLREVLSELEDVSSEELIQPEQEIRLMSALIMKCKGIENGADELRDLDVISKILERLIHAKQRSQAIMIEQQRLIPASDVSRFIDFVEQTLIKRIGDEGYTIIDEFKNFKLSQN